MALAPAALAALDLDASARVEEFSDFAAPAVARLPWPVAAPVIMAVSAALWLLIIVVAWVGWALGLRCVEMLIA